MAEVSGFSSLLSMLTGVDAFSLMFPFFLAWMLYYAMIEKAKIFEETELENAAPVMALILAFFTARFLVIQDFYQDFFAIFFGKVVIGLASILGLFTLLGFAGIDVTDDETVNGAVKWIAAAMAGAAFIWAGGFGRQIFTPGEIGNGIIGAAVGFLSFLITSGAIWWILIGGGMIWLMYQGRNNDDGGGGG